MRVLRVQTTLRGYSAWVLERLMQEKGELLADVTKYVFDRWSDDNADYLAKLGITREEFLREEKGGAQVVPMRNAP
ncbi:MAG TPA: hypothetical protein VN181_08195 [Thermoanaerobaculia bacterium]|nr:hypothetical protein [Thermoanaerobaculia bacterium]